MANDKEKQQVLREVAALFDAALHSISRREFLQVSGLMMTSMGMCSLLSGCGGGGGDSVGVSPYVMPVDEKKPVLKEGQQYVMLETRSFAGYGGWTLETQFMAALGFTYLISEGIDSPVSDATASLKLPQSGTYHIFAHCKNWAPDCTPGTFQVTVDGVKLPNVLGVRPEGQWLWEKAGTKELGDTEIEIALHDITGQYGRCSALLFTTDPDFVPPTSHANNAWLRGELLKTDQARTNLGTFDFVVVGGGVGGAIAAISAARNGCRVALLQNRPVLGGNASNEVGVSVASAANANPNARETGLVEELLREAQKISWYPYDLGWQGALAAACTAEANLQIFVNAQVTGVVMGSATAVAAIEAENVITGEKLIVYGQLFADCTGDAEVGVAAGTEFRTGREASAAYNEDLAPLLADSVTLGTSLLHWYRVETEPQPYTAPKWARNFNQFNLQNRDISSIAPLWWIEWGGTLNTIINAEDIRDELLRVVYGVWDYIKNRSYLSASTVKAKLVVRKVAGKRESRRLIGDYVMSEADVKGGTPFSDAVCYGGWGIDLHALYGIYDPGPPGMWSPVVPYNIPFRSLYSKNIDNLMMAGRNVSVSHVALGSTRIQGTCGTMGQAIGTAAALCRKHGATPRQLAQRYITELQQCLLRDDAYIIGIGNNDSADFARTARVSSSSMASWWYAPQNVTNGVSRAVGFSTNMWASDPTQLLPQWIRLDFPQAVSIANVQISFDTNLSRFPVVSYVEPETVKDYEVQVLSGGNWLTVAKVTGNYRRLRRHSFSRLIADAVRINVLATNGDPSARIFEVRVYDG